ncbi:MAG: hypothetical protein QM726_04650 [Chitinophagaceae bacterium]
MTELIGRFHPLLVHLPIGILLLACVFQLLSAKEKYASLQHAVSFSLFWGMLSAIASCITGYLLSNSGEYDEDLVSNHQWMGISVAVISAVYYLLYKYNAIQKYKWALPVVLITLITITGHLGGSLTHGSDYLTSSFEKASGEDSVKAIKPIPNVQEAVVYADIIQPMLQNKCYSCHGANKQKGKLRMDQPDLLMKGGKDGVVVEAGKADESELIKRIMLEKADEHHMPPKEKPQLTANEIAILHWWIAGGASFDKKTKDLAQTEKIKPALLSFQHAGVSENKTAVALPATPVDKADAAALKILKDSGIVVIPVAENSNYLSASFVTKANASDATMQLLLAIKKQLVWLNLNDTKITDASTVVLAQCSNLIKLELNKTFITDKGLPNLSSLQQLKSLSLVGTKITATGLMQLKGLKALQSVYLYQTSIKSSDWPLLSKSFAATTKLDSGGYQVPILESDTTTVKPPKTKE